MCLPKNHHESLGCLERGTGTEETESLSDTERKKEKAWPELIWLG